MKKMLVSLLTLCAVAGNVSAAEVRYFAVSGNVDGASYCQSVWPGSQYAGVRTGNASYYFIACQG